MLTQRKDKHTGVQHIRIDHLILKCFVNASAKSRIRLDTVSGLLPLRLLPRLLFPTTVR